MLWWRRPPAPIGSRTARLADAPPGCEDTDRVASFQWLVRARKQGRTRHYMRRTRPAMEETIKELLARGWRCQVYELPR